MARRGVDPECYRLAEHFLADRTPEWWSEAQRADFVTSLATPLAEVIQKTIEDWFLLPKENGVT